MVSVLVAPDKFKGSLTSAQVAAALAAGVDDVAPTVRITRLVVSDGGDGLIDSVLPHGFVPRTVAVSGPTGRRQSCRIATRRHVAVIELAEVVGLRRLPGGLRAPMTASTYGLGEAVAHALDQGATDLVLGLGGSASTDGGAGMLQALGARVLASTGCEVARGGAALAEADRLDLSDLDPRLRDTRIVLASDVDCPLLGPSGAARVFGPQKGATKGDVEDFEAALLTWVGVVSEAMPGSSDVARAPGAGAAGGTGFAALAVLGATMRPGVDLVMEFASFDDLVASADLVIVGEGSLDTQSLRGKAPVGIARAAARAGCPVVAACGINRLSETQLRGTGLTAVYSLESMERDPAKSVERASPLLRRLGRQIATDHLPSAIGARKPTERFTP